MNGGTVWVVLSADYAGWFRKGHPCHTGSREYHPWKIFEILNGKSGFWSIYTDYTTAKITALLWLLKSDHSYHGNIVVGLRPVARAQLIGDASVL